MIKVAEDLLICPSCRHDLRLMPGILRCDQGHAYDISASGYVNLTSPPGRRQSSGDTTAMVNARLAFLKDGHFEPLVEALKRLVPRQATVADLGSGPAFYSAALIRRTHDVQRVVAVDASLAAMKQAARLDPAIAAVRANLRTLIPIKSDAVDLALVVFAPRNVPEWHRVIRTGGSLAVVIPGSRHLQEMRNNNEILAMEADKLERVVEQASRSFQLEAITELEWQIPGNSSVRRQIVEMGPSAHHQLEPVDPNLVESVTCHMFMLHCIKPSQPPTNI